MHEKALSLPLLEKAWSCTGRGKHGCYWVRRTEGRAYEIRIVPSSLDEPRNVSDCALKMSEAHESRVDG